MKKTQNIVSPKEVMDVNAMDIVVNGKIYENVKTACVMVESEEDLETIAGDYSAGTFAFTAGLGTVWQLSASGTWTEVE